MRFSEKLQYLRKERNLSQEQLADMLDVSRQSVSKWESGQTYPEMDKLISICSIFKCTLDDLTNDEVTDISKKSKNTMSNIIDEAFEFIRKSIYMFKSMRFKSIVAFGFEMLVIFLMLLLFNLPVRYIYSLGNNIFMNFGFNIGNILSSIWNFILQVSYLILAIIIFIYIYKIRYLDKFDYSEEKIITSDKIEIRDENNEVKKVSTINTKKESSYTIFNSLGKLALYFIKFVIICISIPFMFVLFFLSALLIISVVLLFKGILYFGPIIMVFFGGVFVYIVLELIYNFIFNRKNNKKKIFILFITSIIGLGIGFGVSAIEIANTKYVDDAPHRIKEKSIIKEYNMNDNLFVKNYWSGNIEYVVDETLKDTIKIDVSYYDDYSNIVIEHDENDIININRYDIGDDIYSKIFNLIFEDLSNKTIYAYGNLQNIKVKVHSSSSNIDDMKNNETTYYQNIYSQEQNNWVQKYQNELNEKNNKIYELEREINSLKDKINSNLD